ncbi:MAG: xanthine dehydrogenase family protein subunit M [Polyangiaceae bacterium]|jgi:xanthine dehydrogenase YagS FAD-binding subunit
MRPFTYVRATDEDHALAGAKDADAAYVAGGTTLIDLMRLDVVRPGTLVDLTALPLAGIEAHGDGVRIGAMARNTDVAYAPIVVRRYPVLAEALLSGASPQLRNMATVGGNVLQRTRCPYFRDTVWPCNKRQGGAGCSARDGYARMHAVLGTSDQCIAVHPSDMCVALLALDAVVQTARVGGRSRSIPFAEFHTLPGQHPEVENVLERGELITAVDLPAAPFAERSHYVKVRDRTSYAFALASAAVALDLSGTTVRAARIVLGGVATRPWRSLDAEAELVGRMATTESFRRAGAAAVHGARPLRDNAFKVELAQRTVVRALQELMGAA